MMYTRLLASALFALSATFATIAAHAANVQAPDRVQEANGITFVSGGIGTDSRDSLLAREKSYNFKLVLTLDGSGAYVSDARITLATVDGRKLVEHLAEGPLFMAGLPAGTYVVTAVFRNQMHTRKIQVRGDRLRTEYMRWPADPALDVTMPWDAK